MKMKLLFWGILVCGAMTSIACNDDDDRYTPNTIVVKGFNAKYPAARNVSWETKAGYNVADFRDGKYEAEAWFNEQGAWMMTETDLSYAQLPAAVKESFKNSLYKNWRVDDVDKLERSNTDSPLYIIEAEQGEADVDLYYSETGALIKEIKDQDDDMGYQPVTIPAELTSFIQSKYPNASILEYDREKNYMEIDILDGRTVKEVSFSLDNNWLQTEWEVRTSTLPAAVKDALDTLYPGYKADNDADYFETPAGDYYLIELERNNREIKVKLNAEGKELK